MIPTTLGAVADITGGRLHGCGPDEAAQVLVDGPVAQDARPLLGAVEDGGGLAVLAGAPVEVDPHRVAEHGLSLPGRHRGRLAVQQAGALQGLAQARGGELVCVFGCGGDRDRGKRPLMGEAARQFADVVFVTDDNPRTEDPAAIRAEVMAGAGPEATEVGDRAEAILRAVDGLEPGDAALICGKGHETGQIVGSDVFPFDDAEQASVAVAALDGKL